VRDVSAIRSMMSGKAQSAAALAELRRIESEGPAEVKAYALHALIEAYWFGGDQEKAYVPFSQAIAWYDVHPEWFDQADRNNLFWSFKWMVNGLRSYPRVAIEQLESTLDDMERRYALEGFTRDAPCQQRWHLARHRGLPDVPGLYDEWCRQTRDEMSDCDLCATGDKVEYLIETGYLDDGLQLMEATFADPSIRQECFSEPATMLSIAQFAYLQRGTPGDAARAAEAHRRCRSYWDQTTDFGSSSRDMRLVHERAFSMEAPRSSCIEFLARTHNGDAAIRLLESNRRFLLDADSPLSHLVFLTHTGTALKVLVDDFGRGDQAVTSEVPDVQTLEQLWKWVRTQAENLAAAFDARNGTSHQSDRLHEAWEAMPLDPLDLRVVTEVDDYTATAPPPDDQTGADSPDLVTQADRLARHDQPAQAIASYLRAADEFESAGELVKAGFARAEAGHLALLMDDLDGAERCLTRATQLLRAAGTPPEFCAPVVVAQADCLAKLGRVPQAEAALGQIADALDAAIDGLQTDDLAPDVAQDHQDDLRWARASIDEQRASNLIAAGDTKAGAVLAQQVAEKYADLGLIQQSADAFGAAGQAWDGLDDEQAIWCLQSAIEGYELVGNRPAKSQIANSLVSLFQRLGRDQESAAVAL